MKVINPYIMINKSELDAKKLISIEKAGRTCYKSESAFTLGSANAFIKNVISRGHESVIEHEKVTVMIVCDRGVTHEIVRHRIASYSQESTRYCNYTKDKFGEEITVIYPYFYNEESKKQLWENACLASEKSYIELIKLGSTPQEARSVLPNSLKTEIIVTFNFREWRHFFKLRCAKEAHPQMQQISIPLLLCFKDNFTCLFDDIEYNKAFEIDDYAAIKILN